jgi:hypothetical protein
MRRLMQGLGRDVGRKGEGQAAFGRQRSAEVPEPRIQTGTPVPTPGTARTRWPGMSGPSSLWMSAT